MFDFECASAQGSKFERRQFICLWWDRDSHLAPGISGTYSPADWMPAYKLAEPSKIKIRTLTQQPVPMMSEHSAYLMPWRSWIAPGSGDIYISCLIFNMFWHRDAISNRKETSCLPLVRTESNLASQEPTLQQTEFPLTNRLSYRGSSPRLSLNNPAGFKLLHERTRTCEVDLWSTWFLPN